MNLLITSYHLPWPLGRLTPIAGCFESYAIKQFSLIHPQDFHYLFMFRIIKILNKNNKNIIIGLKRDRSIIFVEKKLTHINIKQKHIYNLCTFSICLHRSNIMM